MPAACTGGVNIGGVEGSVLGALSLNTVGAVERNRVSGFTSESSVSSVLLSCVSAAPSKSSGELQTPS